MFKFKQSLQGSLQRLKLTAAEKGKPLTLSEDTLNPLPPEILLVIFRYSLLHDEYSFLRRRGKDEYAYRNMQLYLLALVCKDWHEVANSVLYGHVALYWSETASALLRRTLTDCADLAALVKSFDTRWLTLAELEGFTAERRRNSKEVMDMRAGMMRGMLGPSGQGAPRKQREEVFSKIQVETDRMVKEYCDKVLPAHPDCERARLKFGEETAVVDSFLQLLSDLPNLRQLHLRAFPIFAGWNHSAVTTMFKNLYRLHLDNVPGVFVRSIIHLNTSITEFQYTRDHDYPFRNHTRMQRVYEGDMDPSTVFHCPPLHHLSLVETLSLDPTFLHPHGLILSLLPRVHQLQSLQLSYRHFTPDILESLTSICASSLRLLSLDIRLSNAGSELRSLLITFIRSCTRLRRLYCNLRGAISPVSMPPQAILSVLPPTVTHVSLGAHTPATALDVEATFLRPLVQPIGHLQVLSIFHTHPLRLRFQSHPVLEVEDCVKLAETWGLRFLFQKGNLADLELEEMKKFCGR